MICWCRSWYVVVLALTFLLWLPTRAAAQTPLGAYTEHRVEGATVEVWADTSALRFAVYASDVIRVDLLPSPATRFDSSRVVVRSPDRGVSFTVTEHPDRLEINTSAVAIRVTKHPVRVQFFDRSGQALLREPEAGGASAEGEARRTRFTLAPDEHLYGTGQRGIGIDLRGESFVSYNQSIFGYQRRLETMNINVPLLLSSRGYALYWDNPYPGHFDLGSSQLNRMTYAAEGGELSYYFIAADSFPKQLERYTWLTGRPPLPPKWALGYLQSKYGYRDEAAAREVVQTFREKRIPADGLILDLYWFEHMGDLAWNIARWPDPEGMIADFEAQGMKTITITEPYFTEPSDHFDLLTQTRPEWAARRPDGRAFQTDSWFTCGCPATLLDITHPEAQAWFWDQYESFMAAGVHGLWTDLGEPEVHPSGLQHAAGSAKAVHNVYNLIWAQTVYDGFRSLRPNQRLVNLTRSGYAGIQRYGVFTWSADVARSFDGLAVQLPIMLNTSLSGLGYHSSDLGGFVGETSPELYMRWMQMGAFTPVMRAHGIDNQPTEPWGFGPTAEDVARSYIELRYRLLLYIYTMAETYHRTGLPLVRPLLFDDPSDPRLADEERAYLFGDDLLVAPVVQEGAREKTLYLPEGRWIDYWTDTVYEGGQEVTVRARLGELPLFVRAGSIIPMQPLVQYVGQRPVDTLTVKVWPEAGTAASFRLYEDDNLSQAYRQGAFARTAFEQRWSGDALTLTLGAAEGQYEGQPESRTYRADVRLAAAAPERVTVDGAPLERRRSLDDLTARGGYFYDPIQHRLWVQVSGSVRTAREIRVEPFRVGAPQARPSDAPVAKLLPNYPNPFHRQTSIPYTLNSDGRVRLSVYDVLGRHVATLVDEWQPAGYRTVPFGPASAPALASGVYLVRLEVQTNIGESVDQTRRITLVRP